MSNTAIYPGTFDPFTNGHLDIVKKASSLFDTLYVTIGINPGKVRTYSPDDMILAIQNTLKEEHISNCIVCACDGLIAEYTKQNNIGYMIRGLRNNMDYNYEENLAEVNKLINPALEYVYFRAENIAVSSSMVKELSSYGSDVSKYVPAPVLNLINNK